MNDTILVAVIHSGDDLTEKGPSFSFRESLIFVMDDAVEEITTCNVFHHKENIATIILVIVQFNNVRVMHGTKEIDFASNSCPVSRFLYTGTCDEFEGDTFPGRQLCCQLNLPVAPLPDSLFQPVISFNHGSVSVFDDSSISTDPCPRIQRQTI